MIVCPINSIFYLAWRVVRLFLPDETAAKFALLTGASWRADLLAAVGEGVALPPHLRQAEVEREL